jgi:hypothetical protein
MPICSICGEYYPSEEIRNGKRRNIGFRKKCLKCEPMHIYEQTPENISGLCLFCKKPIDNSNHKTSIRTQYCSDKCMHKYITYKKRYGRKKILLDIMGGKCSICGYNKCLDALEFHHIDPKEKDKKLGNMMQMKWETILEESKKCILVCANCHREIHFKTRVI